THDWLRVVNGVWSEPRFSHSGAHYKVEETILEPKPFRRPRPTIYAGGESPAAKELISRTCDAYVMHGDPPERVAPKIADMRARREIRGLESVGVDLLLLQFSPQLEEMERFSETVMPLVETATVN